MALKERDSVVKNEEDELNQNAFEIPSWTIVFIPMLVRLILDLMQAVSFQCKIIR